MWATTTAVVERCGAGGVAVGVERGKGIERAPGSGPVAARGDWVESCSAESLRRFLLEQPRGEGAPAVHSASLSCLRKSCHDAFGFTQPTTWCGNGPAIGRWEEPS